ncbi:MAG TPA: bifunctional precorrin-2 dehydrogenase/sirohydrochlorin ferrochelatase [Ilumatobacteraceae bacterium]|nr:bifunctional precorrin-2 dehydrogenase/sirohydrochlorin ferrochelatase [Ilumatobacteraceae bacterium]
MNGHSAADQVTFGYPVVLDLHGVRVLVVGAGPVAVRKISGLVIAGADVRVVAPEIDEQLDTAPLRTQIGDLRRRHYETGDLEGVRLVVTATGIEEVDAAVAADARARGIWVNAADQPADCDLILPAIARQGSISVAVSTDGKSPALAANLRDRIASLLTPELAALADDLAAERTAIKAAGGSTEDHDWSARIAAVLDRPSSVSG